MSTTTAEVVLDPEKEYEIVDGRPEEKEMGGAQHGRVGSRLISRLAAFVEANGMGVVYAVETSFRIGQNVRIPDVAFVSADRIRKYGEPAGFWPIAPDLAIEIVSPNDLYERVLSKITEYFEADVSEVWLISLEHRMISIFHSPLSVRILGEADELVSDLFPDFRCSVAEIFKGPLPG
jgi:Uma2 family endonuclease